MRKIILYIVYGDDKGYYDGAKFSFLTFMNWISEDDPIEIVVLTEKPEEFANYPVSIFKITNQQKKDWSMNDSYHFRIKNRGMAFVMDKLNLDEKDKILFFDTDTYFNESPLELFNFINSKQALFYLNEGFIYGRKRFDVYIKHLEGRIIQVENVTYQLTKKSCMWGSLMVGIMPNMRSSLELADKLMIELIKLVPAHTVEPFALSEILLRKYTIAEGKSFVSLYSTSRKKDYCKKILSNFFDNYRSLNINEQIKQAQRVKMKRPLHVVLKQRFLSL